MAIKRFDIFIYLTEFPQSIQPTKGRQAGPEGPATWSPKGAIDKARLLYRTVWNELIIVRDSGADI